MNEETIIVRKPKNKRDYDYLLARAKEARADNPYQETPTHWYFRYDPNTPEGQALVQAVNETRGQPPTF